MRGVSDLSSNGILRLVICLKAGKLTRIGQVAILYCMEVR